MAKKIKNLGSKIIPSRYHINSGVPKSVQCNPAWNIKVTKYRMRTVKKVVKGGEYMGRPIHRLKLECGHIMSPLWNHKTHYTAGVTKARCYECN